MTGGSPTPGSELASRLVAAAARTMPARRAPWGEAMLAELDALPTAADRRRFALGCLLAILRQPAVLARGLSMSAAAGGLVLLLALAAGIGYPPLRVETVALVLLLAGCSLAGCRAGALGPAGPGMVRRTVRALGHLAVGALALMFITGMRFQAPRMHGNDPQPGTAVAWGITAVVILCFAVGLLLVTAAAAPIPPRSLAIAAGVGGTLGLSWIAVVLPHSYIAAGTLSRAGLVTVGLAWLGALAIATRRGERPALTGLVASVIASLLIVTAPLSTYALFPSTVPDPTPGAYSPQLSAADHRAQNEAEASDPYVGAFLLGGLLAAWLCGTSRPRRPRAAATSPDQTLIVTNWTVTGPQL